MNKRVPRVSLMALDFVAKVKHKERSCDIESDRFNLDSFPGTKEELKKIESFVRRIYGLYDEDIWYCYYKDRLYVGNEYLFHNNIARVKGKVSIIIETGMDKERGIFGPVGRGSCYYVFRTLLSEVYHEEVGPPSNAAEAAIRYRELGKGYLVPIVEMPNIAGKQVTATVGKKVSKYSRAGPKSLTITSYPKKDDNELAINVKDEIKGMQERFDCKRSMLIDDKYLGDSSNTGNENKKNDEFKKLEEIAKQLGLEMLNIEIGGFGSPIDPYLEPVFVETISKFNFESFKNFMTKLDRIAEKYDLKSRDFKPKCYI